MPAKDIAIGQADTAIGTILMGLVAIALAGLIAAIAITASTS
ncbi:hypothetical protein [Acidithiobacillus ferrianus]